MTIDRYRAKLMERFGPDTDDVLAGLGLAPDVVVDELPWLCDLIDAGEELPLKTVPRTLGVRLRSLIHDVAAPADSDERRELPVAVAHLQSDTRRERELVGVRGGSVDNWTLMFRSQVADVVMGVSTVSPTELRIAGQVLVHDGDQRQFAAELTRQSQVAQADVQMRDAGDSYGRFNFDHVPSEQLQLLLSDGVNDIVAELDLADPATGDDLPGGDGLK